MQKDRAIYSLFSVVLERFHRAGYANTGCMRAPSAPTSCVFLSAFSPPLNQLSKLIVAVRMPASKIYWLRNDDRSLTHVNCEARNMFHRLVAVSNQSDGNSLLLKHPSGVYDLLCELVLDTHFVTARLV